MSTAWNSTWMAVWKAWALRVAEAFRSPSGPLPPSAPQRAAVPKKALGVSHAVAVKWVDSPCAWEQKQHAADPLRAACRRWIRGSGFVVVDVAGGAASRAVRAQGKDLTSGARGVQASAAAMSSIVQNYLKISSDIGGAQPIPEVLAALCVAPAALPASPASPHAVWQCRCGCVRAWAELVGPYICPAATKENSHAP